MTIECSMLLWAALLTLLLPVIQGAGASRVHPISQLAGNRENFGESPGWVGRCQRAHRNSLENLVPFAIMVLVAHGMGISTPHTVLGAEIFLAARVAYAVLDILGVVWLRTIAYYTATIGTVMIAWAILHS